MGSPLVMMSHTQVNKTTATTIYNYIIVTQPCIRYQEHPCCSLEKVYRSEVQYIAFSPVIKTSSLFIIFLLTSN